MINNRISSCCMNPAHKKGKWCIDCEIQYLKDLITNFDINGSDKERIENNIKFLVKRKEKMNI